LGSSLWGECGVAALPLGVGAAVDPSLGEDRVASLHRYDRKHVDVFARLGELDDGHQPRQAAADDDVTLRHFLAPPGPRDHIAQGCSRCNAQLRGRALGPLVMPALLGAVAAVLHGAEAAAVVARSIEEEPGAAPRLALGADADQA